METTHQSPAQAAGQQHTYEIVVNGRKKAVESDVLTFEQVVVLASLPPGAQVTYTVTYRHAAQHPAEGTLVAGQSVKIKNGTAFVVTATDKS